MFSKKPYHFIKLSKSYPILKLVDIYNRQSFIRAYVLDNIYVGILLYILFYVALWYATVVVKRIEKSNKKMLKIVEENRMKLTDVTLLKNKKTEYEAVVIKAAEAQRVTSKHLENEMQRLSRELMTTSSKMAELEKIISKYKTSWKSSSGYPAGDVDVRTSVCPEGFEGTPNSFEIFKILEPSFPPPVPPEPPPRKYGIFVSRPPGERRNGTGAPVKAPRNAAPKIGFK